MRSRRRSALAGKFDYRVCGRAWSIGGSEDPLNAARILPVAAVGEHLACGVCKDRAPGIALRHEACRTLALGERDVEVLLGLERDADQRHT